MASSSKKKSKCIDEPIQEFQNWCRLCARKNPEHFVAPDDNNKLILAGSRINYARTLEQHFRVKMERGDELPTIFCHECCTYLRTLNKFSDRVLKVQHMYRAILDLDIKDSMALDSIRSSFGIFDDEEKLPPEPEVVFVDAQPAKGNQQQHPLVESEFVSVLSEKDEKASKTDEGDDKQPDDDEDESESDSDFDWDQPLETPKKPEPPLIHCDYCPMAFKMRQHFSRHMKATHNKVPPQLPCKYCDKKFATEHQIYLHEMTHFPGRKPKPFKCPHCDKRFAQNNLVQHHIKIAHLGERPFVCDQCGFGSRTYPSLKEHLLTHTEYRPFICDVCEKGFKSKTRLKLHKEMHDSVRHSCPICGMQLKTRATYNKHMLVHSDQREHKCGHCDRSFKRSKSLKNHLLLHTGLKPYTCIFCKTDFPTCTHVRLHQKKNHAKELDEHIAAGNDPSATYTRKQIPRLETLKAITKMSKDGDEISTSLLDKK